MKVRSASATGAILQPFSLVHGALARPRVFRLRLTPIGLCIVKGVKKKTFAMNPIETLNKPDLLREQCFVGGRWVKGDKAVDVEDKATGERIAGVPFFGIEETKQAIDQARQALTGWRAKTPVQRSALLRKWFDLMTANASDLAKLATAESG